MDINYCIKRAQKGDKAAFGKLRQLYYPETVYLAARFLLDEKEAGAAADAVFREAADKLSRLKDPELFERWLCWCTARECRERLRERTPALFADIKNPRPQDPAAGIRKKGERISPKKQELLEQIVDAADGLPVLQRFPYLYSRVCGYSVEETAAFLGLRPETVAFRVRSGEAALYEAVHALRGAERAGLDDIAIALKDYPLRYVRPEDYGQDGAFLPEEEESGWEEEAEELPFEEEEEEEEERESGVTGRAAFPLLITVGVLVLAVLVFFIRFTLKDSRSKKSSVSGETVLTVTAATPEPGKSSVTAIPRSAITPPPTYTPMPTATPAPTLLPPDVSGLEYQPVPGDWFRTPYRALVCAESSIYVRNGPATSYKRIGTVKAGQEVLVYGARDSWYLVEYVPGKVGWAAGKYILATEMFSDGTNGSLAGITPPVQAVAGVEIRPVRAFSGARLYRDPSQNGSFAETFDYGTKVCLLCFEGDWIFVNVSGQFGWMKLDAFDTSNAMDVSSGTYRFVIDADTLIEDTGSAVRVQASLYRQEFITPANLEKFLTGSNVKTTNGTKLKPEFTYAERSTAEAEPGVPNIISIDGGELLFLYDPDQKLYGLYTHEEPRMTLYKKIILIIRPDANVVDQKYFPAFELGVPSFGSLNANGYFLTTGDRLDEFADYVRSYGVYEGLRGTLTIRNGAVCEFIIENEDEE